MSKTTEVSQYDQDTLAYLEAAGISGVLLERVRKLVNEVTEARQARDE